MSIAGISGGQLSSLLVGITSGQMLTKGVSGIQGPDDSLGKLDALKSDIISSAAQVAQSALDKDVTIDIKV